ncbi:MAG: hypothetical protein AAGK00_04885 [Pseudomonadota bacterium]
MPISALIGLVLIAIVGGLLIWTRIVRPRIAAREGTKFGPNVPPHQPPPHDIGDGGGGGGGD